ncbi:MAG: hypothetical protein ACR2MO_17760 [Acidimicrobiales bacterium]
MAAPWPTIVVAVLRSYWFLTYCSASVVPTRSWTGGPVDPRPESESCVPWRPNWADLSTPTGSNTTSPAATTTTATAALTLRRRHVTCGSRHRWVEAGSNGAAATSTRSPPSAGGS